MPSMEASNSSAASNLTLSRSCGDGGAASKPSARKKASTSGATPFPKGVGPGGAGAGGLGLSGDGGAGAAVFASFSTVCSGVSPSSSVASQSSGSTVTAGMGRKRSFRVIGLKCSFDGRGSQQVVVDAESPARIEFVLLIQGDQRVIGQRVAAGNEIVSLVPF